MSGFIRYVLNMAVFRVCFYNHLYIQVFSHEPAIKMLTNNLLFILILNCVSRYNHHINWLTVIHVAARQILHK